VSTRSMAQRSRHHARSHLSRELNAERVLLLDSDAELKSNQVTNAHAPLHNHPQTPEGGLGYQQDWLTQQQSRSISDFFYVERGWIPPMMPDSCRTAYAGRDWRRVFICRECFFLGEAPRELTPPSHVTNGRPDSWPLWYDTWHSEMHQWF